MKKFILKKFSDFGHSGLYYKHITIVNDTYRVVRMMPLLGASLKIVIDDTRSGASLTIVKLFLKYRPLVLFTLKNHQFQGQPRHDLQEQRVRRGEKVPLLEEGHQVAML